jgi:hypothetical protein
MCPILPSVCDIEHGWKPRTMDIPRHLLFSEQQSSIRGESTRELASRVTGRTGTTGWHGIYWDMFI